MKALVNSHMTVKPGVPPSVMCSAEFVMPAQPAPLNAAKSTSKFVLENATPIPLKLISAA